MRWLRFSILIIFVMLMQAGLLSNLKIRPDLLLIMLVFFAIHGSGYDAIITSFVIGLAYDLIAASPMGAGIISFGFAGTALAYLQQNISLRKTPFQAIAIFAAGLLCGTMIHFLSLLKIPAAADFLRPTIYSSLYSAVAGPFLFPPTKWMMNMLSKNRRIY